MPRKTEPTYETENGVFPKRLKEIMKKRGENQTSLAKKITEQYVTIQRQTISLYMNGQSKPDTERLTTIAKVLDVSADWLLGLSDVQSMDGEVKQVCKYTGLSQAAVERLHQIATTGNAPNMVIAFLDSFLGGIYLTEFATSAWRATMTQAIYNMNIRNGLSFGEDVPEGDLNDIKTRRKQREDTINKRLLEQLKVGPQKKESIEVSADELSMLYAGVAQSCLDDSLEDAICDVSNTLWMHDK